MIEKNNFDKKVKMHLACSKDDFRPGLQCVYFKNGYAYATDTRILARNRISEISGLSDGDIESLDGKLLRADFYKDMLKYDNIMIAEDGIECSCGADKAFFYFSKLEKFPDADKVLNEAMSKAAVPLPQVSFDIDAMQRLNKALYKSSQCTATFKGVGNPIVFDSMSEDVSSVGLLMPCYNPSETES